MFAISAVDIALWDIVAKNSNLPLCNVLGSAGKRNCLHMQVYGVMKMLRLLKIDVHMQKIWDIIILNYMRFLHQKLRQQGIFW